MTSTAAFTVLYLRSGAAPAGEEAVVRETASAVGAAFEGRDPAAEGLAAPPAGGDHVPVVLIGPPSLLGAAARDRPRASLLALGGEDDAPDLAGLDERIAAVLSRPCGAGALAEALHRAGAQARLLTELHDLRRRVDEQGRELRDLNRIGVALSAERDIDTLLDLILSKCREITAADAGSLYLIERRAGAAADERDYLADKELVFRLTQNDSMTVPFTRTRMDIDRRSVAGYVASTGEPILIEDAYAIPPGAEYRINRAFDEASGYRSRSMLVIPMRNHKEETIGVLQLINRKRDAAARLGTDRAVEEQVIPFDARTAELAASLASQAAVAIENARLYQEIQTLFEGFIRASVTAIESRDPTTSGHSERVAVLTVGLAEKVDRETSGPYGGVRFTRDDMREIHYASLLHDFGKIGVSENVLLKGKKLYEHELRAIKDRFRILRRTLELKYSREKIRHLMERPRREAVEAAAALDVELGRRLEQIDRWLDLIVEANEPTVLRKESSTLLAEMAGTIVEGLDGESIALLEPWEHANLSIGKGSLSPEERHEIESHVSHTYQFLATIPWTRELRQVPRIAGAHHEKLDGSGYPMGIRSPSIPLESRIMTISDIFDALTAKDRPYKRAIPFQKALDILDMEAKEGKVDPALFRLFVEGKVYELVSAEGARSS